VNATPYPRHVELCALTADPGDPARATQWAVRTPDGGIRVFGDQEWVKDGRAAEDDPGLSTVHRDVKITYGPWSDEAPSSTPVPGDLREAIARAIAERRQNGADIESDCFLHANDPERWAADADDREFYLDMADVVVARLEARDAEAEKRGAVAALQAFASRRRNAQPGVAADLDAEADRIRFGEVTL
jgi:hypothetical protein